MELIVERKNARLYEDYPLPYYELKDPGFTPREKELISLVSKVSLAKPTASDLQVLFLKDKEREKFTERVTALLEMLRPLSGKMLSPEDEPKAYSIVSAFLKETAPYVQHKEEVIHTIINDLLGLSLLSHLAEDDELEEVMVNGSGKPVFVFDRLHGICRTNVVFENDEQLEAIIKRMSAFVFREINEDSPLLDARLPDGSRINATVPPASPHSPTITIRKFRKRPITITEMIKNNTISSEVAAFLWMCIDGMHVSPMNMLIAGGTGSGKTTTLNALTVFIPERERVISIEDTLELNLFNRENWVQLESRPGILQKKLDLDDLLKNAIRMRPDRILVGEVRGPEASTMFTAMDIGHQGLLSTLHANSARETILRLQSPPMGVPTSMFTLLDLVLMQHRMYWPRKGLIRRVVQLSEVSVMGEHVLLNDIFSFNREKDVIERTSLPSNILERLSFLSGLKITDLKDELELRKAVLEKLVKLGVFDYDGIRESVTDYSDNPAKLAKKLGVPQ
ncbi:MAG: ATPase, T2SS/T4P/T4SS family [archaeon]